MEISIKCETQHYLPLKDLTPFQGDLKNLTEESYQKFKKQILELGFSAPFFVWKNDGKNFLLDGHQRLNTLTQMEKEGAFVPPLPVVFVSAKDRKEAKKKILAFTSQYGDMTAEGLSDFAIDAELNFNEIDDLFKFADLDLDSLGNLGGVTEGLTDEDEVPEQAPARCKLGDIWKLGDHRLMCGDSTDRATVEKLMNGEKADMVFTDPPYGVNYSGGIQFVDGKVQKENREKLKNDHNEDIYKDSVPIMAMFSDGPIYTWYADSRGKQLYNSIAEVGEYHAMIVWHKTNAKYGALNAQYKQRHEPCVYWKAKGKTLKWCGPTTEATVWEMKRDPQNNFHPTQKPVELAERAISNHTAKSVLDLFGGSGSTLIACEKTNRKCFMMELDPHYCDVIIERWQNFTGKTAELIEGSNG